MNKDSADLLHTEIKGSGHVGRSSHLGVTLVSTELHATSATPHKVPTQRLAYQNFLNFDDSVGDTDQ